MEGQLITASMTSNCTLIEGPGCPSSGVDELGPQELEAELELFWIKAKYRAGDSCSLRRGLFTCTLPLQREVEGEGIFHSLFQNGCLPVLLYAWVLSWQKKVEERMRLWLQRQRGAARTPSSWALLSLSLSIFSLLFPIFVANQVPPVGKWSKNKVKPRVINREQRKRGFYRKTLMLAHPRTEKPSPSSSLREVRNCGWLSSRKSGSYRIIPYNN